MFFSFFFNADYLPCEFTYLCLEFQMNSRRLFFVFAVLYKRARNGTVMSKNKRIFSRSLIWARLDFHCYPRSSKSRHPFSSRDRRRRDDHGGIARRVGATHVRNAVIGCGSASRNGVNLVLDFIDFPPDVSGRS